MAQVFISYSRKDLTFVEHLISDLKKTGIDVWYDLSGLEGGSRWGIEIQNAVQKSDYVIVVLSPDSIASEWVEREYLLSNNLKKKILPIMYRECELPLSFLNLNYIDVQGENYSRNFHKITRFLNTTPLPSSTSTPEKKHGTTPQRTSYLFAVLGVVAALGVVAIFFLSNVRGTNTTSDANGTNTPVQTSVQPTTSSGIGVIPVMETSSPIQPSATSTETSNPPDVMVTSGPTQVYVAGQNQAVFIKTVEARNMADNFSDIDNPLSSDPSVLVFAMPNWSPREIYNNHLIGVWYRESQWALFNQDMLSMPQDAAFNIQILGTGTKNAFVHMATASNISNNWTVINNPLASNQDLLVFAIPNLSSSEGNGKYSSHPIGVLYTGTQWVIFNQDLAPMPEGAAFNIQVVSRAMNAFVHTATSSNISGNSTRIDNPIASDQNALVFAMPRSSPGDNGVYNSHPIGVWYTENRWAIFNQDKSDMPEGATFNILILDPR